MISTAEVGTLEGEAKGKATRIAADEVKELEALDVATIDYSEAEKRQHVSPLLQNGIILVIYSFNFRVCVEISIYPPHPTHEVVAKDLACVHVILVEKRLLASLKGDVDCKLKTSLLLGAKKSWKNGVGGQIFVRCCLNFHGGNDEKFYDFHSLLSLLIPKSWQEKFHNQIENGENNGQKQLVDNIGWQTYAGGPFSLERFFLPMGLPVFLLV